MTNFEEFKLKKELISALNGVNFINPTPVQEKTIPAALKGKNIVVKSKTGTGKTAAFLVPIIEALENKGKTEGMIVVPTRELAIQVHSVFKDLSRGSKISAALIYGGSSFKFQIDSLKKHPTVVIGTPGRIIDMMQRSELNVKNMKMLVLDEADMMLDLGFMDEIEYIISNMPKEKQVMLFSATIPERIKNLSKKYMADSYLVDLNDENGLTVDTISHKYALTNHSNKLETLFTYINEYKPKKSIIFSDTKRNADFVYNALINQGYRATVMHGDLKQSQRERALQEFKRSAQFLVATNVAARGLDIQGISDIINYDIPSEPYVYVHRVGRSARMGRDGTAFTIVSQDELRFIRDIEKSVRIRLVKIGFNSISSRSLISERNTDRSKGGIDLKNNTNSTNKSFQYKGTRRINSRGDKFKEHSTYRKRTGSSTKKQSIENSRGHKVYKQDH